MKTRFSIAPLILTSLIFSGCGSGGTSVSEESFVAGDGVVTFVAQENRSLAPEIKGKSLLGDNIFLEKGKTTVVNIWASWCSPCRAEAPSLQAISEKYPNAQFIGILTRDSKDSALAFSRRFKIQYPTIADDAILLGFRNSLPVTSIPTTIILDKDKKVAARISGAITIASLSELIEKIDNESSQ
ncbi:MAG: TlpA disulfide reductase family protein [Actinobacteria bacterium]|nr:TlpA disulfide reductase family protein [Actinomycetota bacterium]